MKGRVEIKSGNEKEFSIIVVIFPNFEQVQIYPRTRVFISENKTITANIDIKIVECRVGNKLSLLIDNAEYKSTFDVFRIKIKK